MTGEPHPPLDAEDDEVLHTALNDAVPREGTEEIAVPAEAAGMRLDTWLSRLPGLPSRSRMQQLVKDGLVLLDGAPAPKSATLAGGETVRIDWPPMHEPWPRAEAIPLDVLHEDADLLVINKQAGLITHPAPGNPDGTLVNALLHHCPDLPGIYGVRRPGIVHRLDRDTTGLIVVAKTEGAMRSLAAQMAARTAKRTYRALIIGDPPWDEIRVEAAIGRDAANRLRRAIDGAFAKHAVSHFRVERRAGHHSLMEARLETGRTHQIRIHVSHIGHPITGDELYGGTLARSLERLRHASSALRAAFQRYERPFLHARALEFAHPATGRRMRFEAPLPRDSAELLLAVWPDAADMLGERRIEER
ncbi:MAG: RluA family pseudouridine synthase [Candidatus Sumerlaeia bacterium]|nr:RluA family pseudouridine synthase [Candidatus Sumerlaeia bacterium]